MIKVITRLTIVAAMLLVGPAMASPQSAPGQAAHDAVGLGSDGFPVDPKLKDDQVNYWFNYGIFQVSGGHALVRPGNDVQELIDGPETFRAMDNAIRTSWAANETGRPDIVAEYQFGANAHEPILFNGAGLLAEGPAPQKCIYSTSPQGGKNNRGTVFKITPDLRTLTVVHDFDFTTGSGPLGGLSRIGDNFYGTAYAGGKYGVGLIYRVTPDGALTDLWDFRNGKIVDPPPPPQQPSEQQKLDAAGSYPAAAPINAARGGMFGVTTYANNLQSGVLYSGTLKGLYQFKGECGYLPSTLIAGFDGSLYGTCVKGNSSSPYGTVFKATPGGSVSLLHAFDTVKDGGQPFSLMQGKDGVLYGVTIGGGYASNFPGVIFSLTTDNHYSVLHRFSGGADGGYPSSGLVEKDGYLYGAARLGGLGPLGRGVLYRIKPDGNDFSVLHAFDMYGDGKNPCTSLMLHSNGKMYGTTMEGGAKDLGVIYCLDVPRYIYLLGWWLTDDFPITVGLGDSTIQNLFTQASNHDVQVRAMLWDSDKKTAQQFEYWPGGQNKKEIADINAMDNGAAIHDNHTLDYGAHHHKILCVAGSQGLIAFCGGLDINPDRIYRQGEGPNSNGDTKGAPLHDVHCRVQGPAAGDLVNTFLERWYDHSDHVELDNGKGELRAKHVMPPDPIKDATCYVQVGRTFPNGTRNAGIYHETLADGYSFAPRGETSAARIILHAINQAKKFIYIEDQYFVDTAPNNLGLNVRGALTGALPRIQSLIVVIPHGSITDMGPPHLANQVNYRRKLLIDGLKASPGGQKVHIFYRKDPPLGHTYVHAKTWIFDDEFAIVGSANCNRRSWTHDSETVLGICDQGDGNKCRMPHRLRIRLWMEHLGLPNTPENIAMLSDGTAASQLWINLPPAARVMHYEKITPELDPSNYNWDTFIDPDGS